MENRSSDSKRPVRILLLSGSNREHSITRIALQTISQRLYTQAKTLDMHIEVVFYDLYQHPLPLFNDTDSQFRLPEVIALQETVHQADAILVGSPEYHSSLSGVLKNCLDFLSSDAFRRKPIALLVASGGGKGGIPTLQTLRTIFRALYAFCIPQQVVVDSSMFKGDTCVDKGILYRFDELSKELLDLTKMLSHKE